MSFRVPTACQERCEYSVNTEACEFRGESCRGEYEEGDLHRALSCSWNYLLPVCHPCRIITFTHRSLPSTWQVLWHTVGTQACCRSWLGEQGTNDGGGAREVGRRKCRTLTVNSEPEDPGLWLEGLQRNRQGFTTGFL